MSQESYDIAIVHLTVGHTNDELLDLMQGTKSAREQRACGKIVAAIAGYDDDPREVWEIPEVRAFCRRLFNIGFASYLDAFGKDWLKDASTEPSGLGAFEVWMIGEGQMRSEFDVTRELLDEFQAALSVCNGKADAAIGPMRTAS